MTNQLAIRDDMSLGDVAGHFVKSGYFQDAADVSKAVVKIMAGREFGFGPFASMTNIYIIQGRPSLGANLLASAVKRNDRYDYRIRKMNDAACEIEYFQRNGDKWESLGFSTFTLDDARKAGTKNLDKFPRNMLFARAMSNGVRWFCPDVFGAAVYTPEELGADVTEDGDVIDGSFATQPHTPEMTLEAALDMRTPKGAQLGELTDEQLQYLIDHASNGLQSAARLVLDSRKKQPHAFDPVACLVENHISENEHAARGLLKKIPDTIKASPEELIPVGKLYRAWKDSGVTTDQAVEYALDGVAFEQ